MTGRKLVLRCEGKPQPGGYAVFRTLFEAGEVARNERTRILVERGVFAPALAPRVDHRGGCAFPGGRHQIWERDERGV